MRPRLPTVYSVWCRSDFCCPNTWHTCMVYSYEKKHTGPRDPQRHGAEQFGGYTMTHKPCLKITHKSTWLNANTMKTDRPSQGLSGPMAASYVVFYTLRKKVLPSTYFLVLQLVTITGLYSVPGSTKWYLEAPWQAYWGPSDMPVMVLTDTIWSFQVLSRVLVLWQAEAPKIGAWKCIFPRVKFACRTDVLDVSVYWLLT